jgi:FkbM family methyltransferase
VKSEATLKTSYSDRNFRVVGSDGDDSVFNSIKRDGTWEPQIMDLLASLIGPEDVCLDIGANLGAHTLVMSDLAKQVYAFEPSSINSSFLSENVSLNGLSNISVQNLGLGKTAGQQEFTHLVGLEGCSFLTPDAPVEDVLMKAWGQNLERVTETVQITTLDEWAASKRINRLDFVKMDAEGSELAVLDGGAKTFEHFKPKLIVELNKNTLSLYYGIQPGEFFNRLSSIYKYIYLIKDERNIAPVRVKSFRDVEPNLIPGHHWADLLCMGEPFEGQNAAQKLITHLREKLGI